MSRECAQGLEESSPTNEEEEEILSSESILSSRSLLPFEVEVKKPLIEDCMDDLKELEVQYAT